MSNGSQQWINAEELTPGPKLTKRMLAVFDGKKVWLANFTDGQFVVHDGNHSIKDGKYWILLPDPPHVIPDPPEGDQSKGGNGRNK